MSVSLRFSVCTNLFRLLPLSAFCFGLALQASAFHRTPASGLNLPEDATPGYVLSRDSLFTAAGWTMEAHEHPQEPGVFYVAERHGRVVRLKEGKEPILALDITEEIGELDWEKGLLSLALHPQFPDNPSVYLWHTAGDEGNFRNRLVKYQLSHDGNTFDPGSREVLIDQEDEVLTHQGGTLIFGPDGYLYLSVGDGGNGPYGWGNSQKIDGGFFSAVLRLDVDQHPESLDPNPHPSVIGGYKIPADNPFVGATSFAGEPVDPTKIRTEIYALGFRNPFRMSIDELTGDLWVGDVGEASFEEVNLVIKGGNYGWPVYEGYERTNWGIEPSPNAEYIPPVFAYGRDIGVSVTGGFIYRGDKFPELYGAYIFGDAYSMAIWALRFDEDGQVDLALLSTARNTVVGFQHDPRDGGILVTLLDERMWTLEYDSGNAAKIPATLGETGVFKDVSTLELADGFERYEVNVPFWSDNSIKSRAFYIPYDQHIGYDPYYNWSFPVGSIWVKHFDLELEEGNPESAVRVETRLLVKTETSTYGIAYRWNEDQTEATLADASGETISYSIKEEDGGTRIQNWNIPSRAQCMQCHTDVGGHALAFSTHQLNSIHEGVNQLEAMAEAGYFDVATIDAEAAPALSRMDDSTATLTDRAKSYLHANCSYCHQPGGPGLGDWDARAVTMLSMSKIIFGELQRGPIQGTHVVVPGAPEASAILQRINNRGHAGQMPPIATSLVDNAGVALIEQWIQEGLEDPLEWDDWSLPADGDIWVDSNWYGWFWREPGADLIYHLEHGWQYVVATPFAVGDWGVWAYDYTIDAWLYTDREIHGWMFDSTHGRWMYYQGLYDGFRYFWDSESEAYLMY